MVLYFFRLYNKTQHKYWPFAERYRKDRQEILDMAIEISKANPSGDTFCLEMQYTNHTCNSVCHGDYHHEVEEETEETWNLRNGEWIDEWDF
jgi:hypothetical protein